MTAAPSRRCAVILTALKTEYLAVRALLGEVREERHPQGTIYEVGHFDTGSDREWSIAVVEIGAGNVNAGVEAERAITHFKPDVIGFVGVAGGLKDVRVGDVVFATKAYNYASGKASREKLEPRPDVYSASYPLEQRARVEARKPDWRQLIAGGVGAVDSPEVHVGPIAAGEQVVASKKSATFRWIREQYGDALAVEMEGLGLLGAAQHSQVHAMVVRGISDLVDGKRRSDSAGSQAIAARHAAAFALTVLTYLEAEAPELEALGSRGSNGSRAISEPPREQIGSTLVRANERLTSNLLPVVEFGPSIFVARTDFRFRGDLVRAFALSGERCPSEWILTNEQLLSFCNLADHPWATVCDEGTVEEFRVEEWAFSSDADRRREFVQLLNRALGGSLRHHRVYHWPVGKSDGVYGFGAGPNVVPRIYQPARKRRSKGVTVFSRHMNEGVVSYCRHHAFEGRFVVFDDRWYLEITPTYVFTRDGRELHRRHEDLLKGIKRLDRQIAVFSQLLLWEHLLVERQSSLFDRRGRSFLRFGDLAQLSLDVGPAEAAWRVKDEFYENNDDDDLLDLFKQQEPDAGYTPPRT